MVAALSEEDEDDDADEVQEDEDDDDELDTECSPPSVFLLRSLPVLS